MCWLCMNHCFRISFYGQRKNLWRGYWSLEAGLYHQRMAHSVDLLLTKQNIQWQACLMQNYSMNEDHSSPPPALVACKLKIVILFCDKLPDIIFTTINSTVLKVKKRYLRVSLGHHVNTTAFPVTSVWWSYRWRYSPQNHTVLLSVMWGTVYSTFIIVVFWVTSCLSVDIRWKSIFTCRVCPRKIMHQYKLHCVRLGSESHSIMRY